LAVSGTSTFSGAGRDCLRGDSDCVLELNIRRFRLTLRVGRIFTALEESGKSKNCCNPTVAKLYKKTEKRSPNVAKNNFMNDSSIGLNL